MTMPVRETSVVAYIDEQRSGRVVECRKQLLEAIHKQPGATRRELARLTGLDINVVTPRVNELIKAKSIKELGRKSDPITGRTSAMLYLDMPPRMRRAMTGGDAA